MIDPQLLAILCCPQTRQPVKIASSEVLAGVNAKITSGKLRNNHGDLVQEVLEEALLTEDGKILYPIRHGIPVMLIDESIPLG